MADMILTQVKEIHQFMEGEGNFLLAYSPVFLRLLQALKAPDYMDYGFVMCVSGAATRLSWQQGFAAYEAEPNQGDTFVNGDRLAECRKGFKGAGIAYTIFLNEGRKDFWKDNYTGDVVWINGEEGKKAILESIDKGVPVLMTYSEMYSLAIGYKNDGERLCFINLYTPDDKKNGDNKYEISDKNWFEKVEMYARVNSFSPRAIDKKLLMEIMENIVYLARLDDYKNCTQGLRSLEALAEHLVWDEGFERLEPYDKYEGELSWHYDRQKGFYREDGARNLADRFWAGYCDYLCMVNGFDAVWHFFEKYKSVVPEWTKDFEEVSRCACRVCDFSGELWKYVTGDTEGLLKFKENDTRSIFAGHMLRAKIYYTRIVEIFERLLKKEA